jgi:hypothetical protein
MRRTFVRRTALAVVVLEVLLGATFAAIAQAPAAGAGGKGPDILGLRVGMTPQEVYTLLQSIDPTHRVTVGQVLIPPVLGNQPAVYGMAPESLSQSPEMIAVAITLPPNPQQAFLVHRQLNQTIHTTVDQIVASLRQKYGQESIPPVGGAANPSFVWVYNEQGQLASPSVGAKILHDCGNTGLTFVNAGPQAPLQPPPAGVLPQPMVGPVQLPTIPDPSKNPQCQGWVLVRADVVGKVQNGSYDDSLDVTISAYGIEKRAAYALGNALNGVVNKQQQQDLNRARQQSVPKL